MPHATYFPIEPALVATRDLRSVNPGHDFLSFIGADINLDAPLRFERLGPSMTDREYWELLGHLWMYHDMVHPYLRVWRRLFRAPRPGRQHLMWPHERETLARLPLRVTLHRGFSKFGGAPGIAWTPDAEFALAFAERWIGYTTEPDDGLFVATISVPRDLVVACFERESMPGLECVVPYRRGYPVRSTVTRPLAPG